MILFVNTNIKFYLEPFFFISGAILYFYLLYYYMEILNKTKFYIKYYFIIRDFFDIVLKVKENKIGAGE
jgi:hypothetical protein